MARLPVLVAALWLTGCAIGHARITATERSVWGVAVYSEVSACDWLEGQSETLIEECPYVGRGPVQPEGAGVLSNLLSFLAGWFAPGV